MELHMYSTLAAENSNFSDDEETYGGSKNKKKVSG
jgi:hypothetical protein